MLFEDTRGLFPSFQHMCLWTKTISRRNRDSRSRWTSGKIEAGMAVRNFFNMLFRIEKAINMVVVFEQNEATGGEAGLSFEVL